MPPPIHRINPSVPRGYVLNDMRGAWGVIVPEETTNLCKNPSLETATTGYGSSGASIMRTSTRQRRGVYGLEVTPAISSGQRGAIYSETGLTAGLPCTVSVDLLGLSGLTYSLSVSHGGQVNVVQLLGTGIWQRESLTVAALAASSISVEIDLLSRGLQPFWIDGLQIEHNAYATTYVDGDLRGFVRNQVDFYWNGTAHASTSTRTAQTRAGGRVVMFDALGWKILSILGLSLMPLGVLSQPLATGGAYYQTTIPRERSFNLVGDIYGSGPLDLQRKKHDLITCLNPFLTSVRQPLIMTYQAYDPCGQRPISEACELTAHYTEGLDGRTDNNYHEQLAATFQMFLPAIQKAGNSASVLITNENFPTGGIVNYIAQRTATGQWLTVPNGLGPGTNGTVRALLHIGGGQYYVGGDFTSVNGGMANTGRIAKWNGSAWSALGSGATTGVVNAMAVAPNGDLYVAGTFSLMGGVAGTVRIAKWNGSAWSALGSGLDAEVHTLTFGTDGTVLYAGGDFLNSGGTPMARIAKYTVATNTWSAFGAGANGTVRALHRRTFGEIYVGGDFTTIGGVAANRIAVYNGSVFAALSTGSSVTVYAITSSPGGLIYIGGDFTTIGGQLANYIAAWNGTRFLPLGTGGNGSVRELYMDLSRNLLYLAGPSQAGGLTLPDRVATWNGTSFLPLDFDLSGAANIEAFAVEPNGTLMIGFDVATSDSISALTLVTTVGSADAYPTIVISGPVTAPARLWQAINETTGNAIYFDLTLGIGEVVTLTLDPANMSFVSNFRGNIISTIIPGSSVSTWHLQPGANTISMFAASSEVTASIRWREQYLAIENTVIR